MAREGRVALGDRVVLLEPETGRVHLVAADAAGARKQKGLGVFDPGRLVGQAYGATVTAGAKQVVVLRPALADLAATIARKAQIITPKDASRILFELGVGAGDRVFECGLGSGGTTVPLAWAVGASGQIVGQDVRPEFADWTRANVEAAGLGARLETHVGDASAGLAPGVRGPFDAALLDLPEPWLAIPHLVPALAPGARLACYTPQVSQMEQAARALAQAGFAQVRTLELIERAWEVKQRGSRPSFEGLGHTGFLVFARWLGHPTGATRLAQANPAEAEEEESA